MHASKLWAEYNRRIEENILTDTHYELKGLAYWRDRLFTRIVVFLLPVSLIAVAPGVIMSFVGGIPLLALFDLLTVAFFSVIAFAPGINLVWRKALLVLCLYFLAVILLIYLASFGPGLLYLLAITVFTSLIFPLSIARWSVAANLVICVGFAFFIEYQWLDTSLAHTYSLGSWIAVSSNLVFLSGVIVASLHLLFNGLQTTLVHEAQLQRQLLQERQALEKSLAAVEVKNQELEQFTYIASHDLQEPLQTLTSVVNRLEKHQTQWDSETQRYFQFLTQSANRMRLLLTGLLNYARIGKESQPEWVDCETLLQDIIREMQPLIGQHQTTIRLDTLPRLMAFRHELTLLFQHLISNAIKFRRTELSPMIRISAVETGQHWLFSVTDNGIGIEEKFWHKIFVIFQRLHPVSQYEGQGIGLAHCKKIAEVHGGKMWVESQVGRGSTFYFTIAKLLYEGIKIEARTVD
jgi:signal transduction histidine kinase